MALVSLSPHPPTRRRRRLMSLFLLVSLSSLYFLAASLVDDPEDSGLRLSRTADTARKLSSSDKVQSKIRVASVEAEEQERSPGMVINAQVSPSVEIVEEIRTNSYETTTTLAVNEPAKREQKNVPASLSPLLPPPKMPPSASPSPDPHAPPGYRRQHPFLLKSDLGVFDDSRKFKAFSNEIVGDKVRKCIHVLSDATVLSSSNLFFFGKFRRNSL